MRSKVEGLAPEAAVEDDEWLEGEALLADAFVGAEGKIGKACQFSRVCTCSSRYMFPSARTSMA